MKTEIEFHRNIGEVIKLIKEINDANLCKINEPW